MIHQGSRSGRARGVGVSRALVSLLLLLVIVASAASAPGGIVCSKRAAAAADPTSPVMVADHDHRSADDASMPTALPGCASILAVMATPRDVQALLPGSGVVPASPAAFVPSHHPPPPFHPPRLS